MKGIKKQFKRHSFVLAIFLIAHLLFVPLCFISAEDGDGAGEQSLMELNRLLDEKRKEISDIKVKIEAYQKEIQQRQKERTSLENQIVILDSRIAKTKLDIEATEEEIEGVKLEIEKTKLKIQEKEYEISRQKDNLGEFIRKINKYDEQSYLDIMLLNDSFSKFFDQMKYLEDIEADVINVLEKLKSLKSELEDEEAELETKKNDLSRLKQKLEQVKLDLEDEQQGKELLLGETKASESEFQALLQRSRNEQGAADADLQNIEKEIRNKLELKELSNGVNLMWPVDPSRGITAYFHDPSYPYRYIFEHPAIDIRAYQGTVLKAAENGYVARAKDAGKGYSYIMLVHADGISTVYGHVSKILVKEDTYVVKGQTIGLSGGMPGTNGAGTMTTGPHLHFEVRKDGIPVNPLDYLP